MGKEAQERVLALSFPARPERLQRVREQVRESALARGCGEACAGDIVMAVDEACQNIIRHAYAGDPDGEIRLEIDQRDGELVFSLFDDGREVDPARVKPRDLDDVRPGGLGTHLIHEAMDRADFLRPPSGRGNLLRMVKRIA